MIVATYVLLGLAIGAAWLRPVLIGHRSLQLWWLVSGAAVCAGLVSQVLALAAIPSLMLLGVLAQQAADKQASAGRGNAWLAGLLVLSLALALHALPGFHNVLVLDKVRLTPDAAPFTLYANFDKGAVGLVLLALLCRKSTNASEWRRTLRRAAPIAAATCAVVMGVGVAIGYVHLEPKWFAFSPQFLLGNLFFTCVAEEAFFRGVLQEQIAARWSGTAFGAAAAVVVPAILFGLVHAGGGPRLILLGTLAGFGYALTYRYTRRIEAPVLAHFTVNAVHFIGFTYPFVG